jgi:hypothetical protein
MRCRRPLILTTTVAAAAILVAGCGSGSSPGVANVSSSNSSTSSNSGKPPTQAQIQQALGFVQCMHANGVPSFPDPKPGGSLKLTIHQLDASPQVQTAVSACRKFLPAGNAASQNPARTRAQTAALLALARCMRSHGFPSFPDPTGTGQLTHEMLADARIDLHDPQAVAAANTCTSVTRGVITKAAVAHFVAGQ